MRNSLNISVRRSRAREEAEGRGLTNVSFRNPGVEEERLPGEPTYDIVMTHDALHDMSAPHKVMAHVRKASVLRIVTCRLYFTALIKYRGCCCQNVDEGVEGSEGLNQPAAGHG